MPRHTNDIYREFAEMFNRHRTMVWAMCCRHGRKGLMEAEDLAQEVAIALWRDYRNLRAAGNVKMEKAWVWWHARTVLSNYRRQKHGERLPQGYEAPDLERQRLDEEREAVEEMLSCLLPAERNAVRLYLDGYNHAEIARQTGKTEAAVKQTMYRAMQKMKQFKNTIE